MMGGLFFNSDFIESFFRAGNSDIDEILFLLFHPGLGSVLRWHPEVAAKEVDSGPLESFGFVNRREG